MAFTAGVRKKEGNSVYTPRETASTGMKYYSDDYYADGTPRDYAAEYIMANHPDNGNMLADVPESEWGNATRAYTKELIDEFNRTHPGDTRSRLSGGKGTTGSFGSGVSSGSYGKTGSSGSLGKGGSSGSFGSGVSFGSGDTYSQLAKARSDYFGMNYDDWTKGKSYDSLKERYTDAGRKAMDDTLGKASARTGGLASSYATTAANQTYNDYMSAFGDAARSRYDAEKAERLNALNALETIYSNEYSRRQAEEQTAYERSQAEKTAALNEALMKAQYGDYSGLKNLGVDTAGYEENEKRATELERAYAAAQYGDYSYLKNLGIDTTAYELQKKREAELEELMYGYKYGSGGKGNTGGGTGTADDGSLLDTAKEDYPDGILPSYYYDELISRGYTDEQLLSAGFTRDNSARDETEPAAKRDIEYSVAYVKAGVERLKNAGKSNQIPGFLRDAAFDTPGLYGSEEFRDLLRNYTNE